MSTSVFASVKTSKKEVILSNAAFNGLTRIVASTNTQLTGLNANSIIITKTDGKTVPVEKIKGVKAASNKITVDMNADQFLNVSSVGTKIAVKSFGCFEGSKAVFVSRNGEPIQNAYLPGASPDGLGNEGYNIKYADENGYYLRASNPDGSVKILKGLALFIDFPNKTSDSQKPEFTSPKAHYDQLFSDCAQFMENSSYGKCKLEVTPILKWYRMDNDSTTYLKNVESSWPNYIKEALEHAKADGVEVTRYDIVYVVPVLDAEFGDGNNYSYAYIDDHLLYGKKDPYIVIDGKPMLFGVTISGMFRYPSLSKHETGHIFGLPDTYSFFSNIGHWHFTGDWEIMGNGRKAPDYYAWHKFKLGWITEDQVDVVSKKSITSHQISPLETPGGTKCVVVRIGKYSAYIVEYRTKSGNDADSSESGVLVYKVDSSILSGYGEVEVMDPKFGANRPITEQLSENNCFSLEKGQNAFTDQANGITIKVVGLTEDTASVTVTRTKDARMEVPVMLHDAKFVSDMEIQFDTNVPLKYAPYSDSPDYAFTINGTLTNESVVITKPDGSVVPADKITSVKVDRKRVTIVLNTDQFADGETDGTQIATKAFYYFNASNTIKVSGN